MKKLLLLLLLSATYPLAAQIVLGPAQAARYNLSIARLDSLYQDALGSDDGEPAVFDGQDSAFNANWQKFIQNLGYYLNWNDFYWDEETEVFIRIYFSASGRVEYLLYRFAPKTVAEDQEEDFNRLTRSFVRDNNFPLKGRKPFAQYSHVVFKTDNH